MNGRKSLTLNFKTFCEATGLDYNQGTYVSYPFPKSVKAELGRITTDEVLINRTPSLSPTKDVPESSKKTDDSKSSSCFETLKPYDNYMPIIERQLALNRLSENLEADFALKEDMKNMAESTNTNSGNMTSLAKLLNNAKQPKMLKTFEIGSSALLDK
nr:hypothetical protein [Tanacetum cinerariifolium]